MDVQTLAALLQKRLREYMNEGADHLATGGAKDYPEYQRMVGRIDGIALAEPRSSAKGTVAPFESNAQ